MYEHKNGIKYRKIKRDDLGSLFKLKEESWWGTHGTPVMSMRDQTEWYENLDSNKTLVMITEAYTKIDKDDMNSFWYPIGVGIYSNIDWVARTCDLSGSIYKYFRGRKIVKDAFECGLDFGFEILNLHRIQAEAVEYNVPAQKLEIDHLGFKVEGRRRECVYKAGRYYDSIMLGMTRDEWLDKCEKRGWKECCKNISHENCDKSIERSHNMEMLDC
jgi:RimJ/RimL family protein N-acetyltransferase